MSLHPEPIGEIPAETVRVARAAFPGGTVITRLRDEFATLYEDADFRTLDPVRGGGLVHHSDSKWIGAQPGGAELHRTCGRRTAAPHGRR